MILEVFKDNPLVASKPRASGDDPTGPGRQGRAGG